MSVAVVPHADALQPELPIAMHPPVAPAAVALLAQARRGLADARSEREPAQRFIASYLSALRAAAAILAARGRPHRGRAKPASVWVLLEAAAPELREWAAFFASNSALQAAAQSGITRRVTEEAAAELFGQAGRFVELARRSIYQRGGAGIGTASERPSARATPCPQRPRAPKRSRSG
ncbi:SAV_6107 family HEPN domain-containing protein [Amycolatopsis anabasis]|uniref:SAV_6107 family HEPN domain-containing protein n=1 Tax=Amycolatopsis anabasis TaxID=1840409 RepID=UPI00131BFBEB|nr:SAV_6107 family HEPN domain-containing protein [Amycolatopsis anabasis]